MSTDTSKHILIVGGGLAGPCLALSLARHNIRSTIFEIRPTRSDSGGSISLSPSALQVLDRYAGVYDRLKAAGFSYYRFGAYTDGGEKLGEIVAGDESCGDKGYPALRIMRSTLHKILLDAGEEMNGLVSVKYGVRLSSIKEDEKGVTAFFEDGTTSQGDALIGSDGIHSKVREHVLGAEAPTPIFAGTCIVTGFLPRSAAVLPSPDFKFPSFMFTDSGFLMTVPNDPKGEQLTWGINIPATERTREEWREMELSGEAARQAKAVFSDVEFQPIRSLIDNADETRARVWAPYGLPDSPRWHTARVCLIGDAAHALPPNGLGSAMAFEDAAIMTRLLTSEDGSAYEQLFETFERIRRPRIEGLRASGKAADAIKVKSGPWVWFMKKWAFRAFFWWNKGVLFHNKDRYDVDTVDLKASTRSK